MVIIVQLLGLYIRRTSLETQDKSCSTSIFLSCIRNKVMGFLRNSCQLSFFFLIVFLFSSSATGFKRFRRSRFNHEPEITTSASSNDTQNTSFYTQTLDHFSYKPESYLTFQQRYVIDYKYWNGGMSPNAPIFVDFGGEWDIGNAPSNGFLTALAPRYKALIVFLEVY